MPPILSRAARAGAVLCVVTLAGACADGAPLPTAVNPPEPSVAKGGPSALPSRGLIAFHAGLTGDDELYTVQEDGSDLRRITYRAGRDRHPSWSPDGRKLVLLREVDGAADLWTINADGSGAKRLTALNAPWQSFSAPRWSPDGRQIAFGYRAPDNNVDIYLIGANGKGLVRLTDAPTTESQPAWSPDGARIAYTTQAYVAGPLRIHSMRADGTDAQELVPCTSNDGCHSPAYSPDGTTVAYSAESYLMAYRLAGGSAPTPLVFDATSPSWSPDGTKLVYTTVFEPIPELRTVGANGGPYTIISPPNASAGPGSWRR